MRDGILYVHVLQPALHYELERINEAADLAQTETAFRRASHPRSPLPARLRTRFRRCSSLPQMFLKRAQRFLAHVMLDPFRIGLRDDLGHA